MNRTTGSRDLRRADWHLRRLDSPVKRAEERWRKNRAREQERVGFDPRNHEGSRA